MHAMITIGLPLCSPEHQSSIPISTVACMYPFRHVTNKVEEELAPIIVFLVGQRCVPKLNYMSLLLPRSTTNIIVWPISLSTAKNGPLFVASSFFLCPSNSYLYTLFD